MIMQDGIYTWKDLWDELSVPATGDPEVDVDGANLIHRGLGMLADSPWCYAVEVVDGQITGLVLEPPPEDPGPSYEDEPEPPETYYEPDLADQAAARYERWVSRG